MEKILAGDHPVLAALREQLEALKVDKREYAGSGFFAYFSLPKDTKKAPLKSTLMIQDVNADVFGFSAPVGFVLYVKEGLIDCLECSAWGGDDVIDKEPGIDKIYYVGEDTSFDYKTEDIKERDLGFLDK